MSRAEPVSESIERLAGAALVVDRELRVVLVTPGARRLLGEAAAVGAALPTLLGGRSTRRLLDEALESGRPTPIGDDPPLVVRALALGTAARRTGALLLLDRQGPGDRPGVVELHGLWTQSDSMKQVFRIVQRVARSDVTVLVRGETGTGKELVARALHALSPRASGPLRAINCAALPAALLESELFGHARGAFTGAVRDRQGHLELANHGTLFLDEVADLPLELQAKILRVLETRSVLPVGARDPVPIDVRFVSATHRALRKEVAAGHFRADLMYRLRVIPIFLPPLRERPGDVRLLFERFVAEQNALPSGQRRVERVSDAAWRILEGYDWPGNVRELRNVASYAFAIGDGALLTPADLPPELTTPIAREPRAGAEEERSLDARSAEAARLLDALQRSGGNRSRAARLLGVSRVTLWRHLVQLGLERS